MKTLKHLIFVILASPLLISSCGSDECKSFRNEVPTELPPNLKAQLHGLLTYNKWVLANDEGDTIIYEAEGPYTDKIQVIQPGKDPVCNRQYLGSREFTMRFIYHTGETSVSSNPLSSYSINSNTLRVRGDFGTFDWNVSTDKLINSSITTTVFRDSIKFQNTTYYDVYYDSTSSYPVYNNASIGKIFIQYDNSPSFYLIHYE